MTEGGVRVGTLMQGAPMVGTLTVGGVMTGGLMVGVAQAGAEMVGGPEMTMGWLTGTPLWQPSLQEQAVSVASAVVARAIKRKAIAEFFLILSIVIIIKEENLCTYDSFD